MIILDKFHLANQWLWCGQLATAHTPGIHNLKWTLNILWYILFYSNIVIVLAVYIRAYLINTLKNVFIFLLHYFYWFLLLFMASHFVEADPNSKPNSIFFLHIKLCLISTLSLFSPSCLLFIKISMQTVQANRKCWNSVRQMLCNVFIV